jgi:hypothetical protein
MRNEFPGSPSRGSLTTVKSGIFLQALLGPGVSDANGSNGEGERLLGDVKLSTGANSSAKSAVSVDPTVSSVVTSRFARVLLAGSGFLADAVSFIFLSN